MTKVAGNQRLFRFASFYFVLLRLRGSFGEVSEEVAERQDGTQTGPKFVRSKKHKIVPSFARSRISNALLRVHFDK